MITEEAAKERARKAQKTIKEKQRHPCDCPECALSRAKFGLAGAYTAFYNLNRYKTVEEAKKRTEDEYQKLIHAFTIEKKED